MWCRKMCISSRSVSYCLLRLRPAIDVPNQKLSQNRIWCAQGLEMIKMSTELIYFCIIFDLFTDTVWKARDYDGLPFDWRGSRTFWVLELNRSYAMPLAMLRVLLKNLMNCRVRKVIRMQISSIVCLDTQLFCRYFVQLTKFVLLIWM